MLIPLLCSPAGVLGANTCPGSRCNERAVLLVELMIVSHSFLLLG